jgi:hypothetical protein
MRGLLVMLVVVGGSMVRVDEKAALVACGDGAGCGIILIVVVDSKIYNNQHISSVPFILDGSSSW